MKRVSLKIDEKPDGHVRFW